MNALVGELDALAWGCHRTIPDSEPDAACTAAPGPPWSAVEYASTHPHDVRLRRAPAGGNEVGVRCSEASR